MTAITVAPASISAADRPASPPSVAEAGGRAMGSSVHLIAVGDADLLDDVLRRSFELIEGLEAAWSRFRPDSDVSRLNAAPPGTPVAVSSETILLIERGIEAWRGTAGLFDPSMLRAIVSAGYDRDFDEIDCPPVLLAGPAIDGSCGDIVIDVGAGTVTLPGGVGFDPGGLGKGLAADLVAAAALDQGANGMLVNLGGDLRCVGTAPTASGWVVEIPRSADDEASVVCVAEGAVATSTCLRRRWATTVGQAHHLIDPRTGRSAASACDAVTVVAASACDAETLATAIAANGGLPGDLSMLGEAVVILTDSKGTAHHHGPIDRYLR